MELALALGLAPQMTAQHLLMSLLLTAALGLLALWLGAVSRSGFAGGLVVGSWIAFFGGLGAFLVLVGFFVLGTGATRLGYTRKHAAGLAQEGGGRRGSRHALANCGAGVLAATFIPFAAPVVAGIFLVSAFATAASDTLGSEIGQLLGRRPRDPLTLRPVPAGSEGAISLEGTVAGIAGSLLLALLGWAVGLYGVAWLWLPVAGAFVGTTVESLVGARWGKDGRLGNEAMNFLNTVVGGLVGAGLYLLFGAA